MYIGRPSELNATQCDDSPGRSSSAAEAAQDLAEGITKSWMWTALAYQDLKLRYRGSVLGPFWITIGTAIMIAAMGVLYGTLFHRDIAHYLPYVAIGLVVWQLVSNMINEGCVTFLLSHNIIQQVRMPFSIHVYRTVYRNLLTFAHNIVIIPIVMAIFPAPLGWSVLWIIPAFALVTINGIWVSFLFGMLSARFRDVPPIISNFVQVVFFVTPVFWPADGLGRWKAIAELNPLFAVIDLIRAPLLGTDPAPYSWALVIVLTLFGSMATFSTFVRFRSRIAFWV